MKPDYVTTFDAWSNFPLEGGQVDPLSGMEVVEVLVPLGPGTRWIGRKVTEEQSA